MNRLGYCCINLSLGESFRNTTIFWAARHPEAARRKIVDIAAANLSLLSRILEWNIENDIRLYRITSRMFPLADHPDYCDVLQDIKKLPQLRACQAWVKEFLDAGGRLSMHPDQFCVISSANETVRKNSMTYLSWQGKIMDLLGAPASYDAPINLHASSSGIGLELASHNIRRSLAELNDDSVSSRLVFENEDKGGWTVANLLKYIPYAPVTLDFHHDKINGSTFFMSDVINSWRGVVPLAHHSEGRGHGLDRAHADYVSAVPDFDGDIELEAKCKDLAVLKYMGTDNK